MPRAEPRLVTSFYVRASALSEDFNVISEPSFSETSTAEERAAYYNTMADLLEETGCTDEALLAHCRGLEPHARGCWALDLLTGRE